MSVLRHSAWAAAAAVVLAGSRFAFAAILARRLALTDFGQYAYGQWLADFTFMVCSLGATGAIGRYIAEFRHDPVLLAGVVRRWRPFAWGLPWIAAALVPFGAWLSGLSLTPGALALLALWTLAHGLWAMQTAALSGLQRFDLVCLASGIAAAVMVAGALLIPLDGQAPGRIFALLAVSSACAAIVGLSVTRRLGDGAAGEIDPTRWRGMREYAANIWLASLLWNLVWSRGEMPIVRIYLGDDGVARYAAALVIFGGAIQAVMLATSGVAPQLTRFWGEGAHTQALGLARRVMDVQLLLCGVAAVLLIYASPELMQIAFGAGFRGGAGILVVLSLGLIAMTVSPQNHLLQIATDARFNRDSTLAGLAVLMVMAVSLVSILGLPGAALSRAGTMVLMAAVSLFVVRRRWGPAAFSARNVGAVLLIVMSSAAIQSWTTDLAWTARAGLAVTAAVLLVVAVRDVDGRMQAQLVIARVRHAFLA